MQLRPLHSWDTTPTEAVGIQKALAQLIDVRRPLPEWDLVAAADVSYRRFDPVLHAAVVLWSAHQGRQIAVAQATIRTDFPYVPGLLSFREAPVILEAFQRLETRPDVVLVDGHGLAHPRQFGIACHLGLWLDLPTIGCAKTRLCGSYREPGIKRGCLSPIRLAKKHVGYVVRTRTGVKPVFVSAGHRIDLASAVRIVLDTCRGYRLPEPARLAHQRVNDIRRSWVGR